MIRLRKPAKPAELPSWNRREISTNFRIGNGYRTTRSNLSLEGWYNVTYQLPMLPKRTTTKGLLFLRLEAPTFLHFTGS